MRNTIDSLPTPAPAPLPPAAPLPPPVPTTLVGRVRDWRTRHEREESLAFFGGGFLFDALLLKRIDEPSMLIQQGAYLVVIGVLLSLIQYYHHKKIEPPSLLRKIWRFLDHLIHFLMGTLLNGYSIFYFHSASGLTAVGLLVIVAGLLAINEMPRFHKLGDVVLFALYSICLTSYFAYLIPVLSGHLSRWMFYEAVALAMAPISLQVAALWRWTRDPTLVVKQALGPALAVQLAFVLAFAFRIAPPVPLAAKEMGIYHDVESLGEGAYRLSREGSRWHFWEKGDQHFVERPGDAVFVFARIFAPRHFNEDLDVVWFYEDPQRGWRQFYRYEKLKSIGGGQDRGSSTFAKITNPPAGSWRVEFQTKDGYTVGQLSFEVEVDPSQEPRTFFEELTLAVAGAPSGQG